MGRKKVKDELTITNEHKERVRNYCKDKYDTNPEYREYMRDKARKRKAMLRELKKST